MAKTKIGNIKGPKGDKGDTYALTDSDILEIARKVADFAVTPQLYAPTVYATSEKSYDEYDSIRVYDDNRNGYQDLNGESHYFTQGYHFYVDGVLKRNYKIGQSGGRDPWLLLHDIVDPGTVGTVTVTAYGGGFDLEFRESLPASTSVTFSNIVNFTVNGVEYVSGKNMTWESWIYSELSIEGFTVEDGYVCFNGEAVLIGDTFTRVMATDCILKGQYRSAAIKSFTVANLNSNITSGNIFYFYEGMTWADWKESGYNKFRTTYNRIESFKAIPNEYLWIDVAHMVDTPIEGIGYKSGDPVEDGDVIEATTYYSYDYDLYDPRTSITVTLEAGAASKTLFEGEGFRKITLNGIDGLTDAVSSIVSNDDGTITVNYETDTDIEITVHYIGFKKQN